MNEGTWKLFTFNFYSKQPLKATQFIDQCTASKSTLMCDALRDLVSFVQFKKKWKSSMEEC